MTVTTTTSSGGSWKVHTGTLQEILNALDNEARNPRTVVMFVNGAGFSVLVKE